MIPSPDSDALARELHAAGPSGEHRDELMLFGQFVGSWQADWLLTTDDGRSHQLRGEVHFGWVLAGMAIQDTWIVPGPDEWAGGRPPLGFYGTTTRFYDPVLGAWRSTWIDPPNGRVRRFTGGAVAEGIALLSDEEAPQLRWTFTDIQRDSFRWQGEIRGGSADQWRVHQDARLHRTVPGGEAATGRS